MENSVVVLAERCNVGKRASKFHCIKDIFHSKRKGSMATELLAHGASEQDVAVILGISPTIVKKHYGEVVPSKAKPCL